MVICNQSIIANSSAGAKFGVWLSRAQPSAKLKPANISFMLVEAKPPKLIPAKISGYTVAFTPTCMDTHLSDNVANIGTVVCSYLEFMINEVNLNQILQVVHSDTLTQKAFFLANMLGAMNIYLYILFINAIQVRKMVLQGENKWSNYQDDTKGETSCSSTLQCISISLPHFDVHIAVVHQSELGM